MNKKEMEERIKELENQNFCMRKLCGALYNYLICPPLPGLRKRMGVPEKGELIKLLEEVCEEVQI